MDFFNQSQNSLPFDAVGFKSQVVTGTIPSSPSLANPTTAPSLDYSKTAQEYLLTSFYKKIRGGAHENDQEYNLFMKFNKPPEKPATVFFPSKPSDTKRYKGYYLTGPEILDFYEAEKNTVHKK